MKCKVEVIVFRRNAKSIEILSLHLIPLRGGMWQPVTGSVENSDATLLDAALRELHEETGIDLDDIVRILNMCYSFTFKGRARRYVEFVFGVEVRSNVIVDLSKNVYVEHDGFLWSDVRVAMKLWQWESQKNALRLLSEQFYK